MSAVPVSPRRVFGVDFSGARDAGRHIWVCRAHPGTEGIRVESVEALARLPGGAVNRDEAHQALVRKVVESPRSAWGFDFPFGLPAPIDTALHPMTAPGDLASRLATIAAHGDAETFRRRCRGIHRPGELKRRTDVEAAAPFSPYNLRLYRQTYHGMVNVLRPLVARSEVAVLPFDELPAGDGERLAFNRRASATAPHVYLMEICPASLLRALDYPHRGYKGGGEDRLERRREILARLVAESFVRPLARALRTRVTGDRYGDALDALLAAVAAWRGYREFDHGALRRNTEYCTEGFVYR